MLSQLNMSSQEMALILKLISFVLILISSTIVLLGIEVLLLRKTKNINFKHMLKKCFIPACVFLFILASFALFVSDYHGSTEGDINGAYGIKLGDNYKNYDFLDNNSGENIFVFDKIDLERIPSGRIITNHAGEIYDIAFLFNFDFPTNAESFFLLIRSRLIEKYGRIDLYADNFRVYNKDRVIDLAWDGRGNVYLKYADIKAEQKEKEYIESLELNKILKEKKIIDTNLSDFDI